jgi:hypothetical protein
MFAPFKSQTATTVMSNTRGAQRDNFASFSHTQIHTPGELTYYDRRRAGALSKVDYEIAVDAFGQELWALMCATVDMLWDSEQLNEKLIVMATRYQS